MIFRAISESKFLSHAGFSGRSQMGKPKPTSSHSRAAALTLAAALCLSGASSPALATGGHGGGHHGGGGGGGGHHGGGGGGGNHGGGGGITVTGPECIFSGPAKDLLPESITYRVKNTGRSYIHVTVSGTQGLQLSPAYLSIGPNQVKEVRVKANIDRRRPATYRGSISFSGPTCNDVKKSCIITVTDPNPVSP